jgi:hypothetical protein
MKSNLVYLFIGGFLSTLQVNAQSVPGKNSTQRANYPDKLTISTDQNLTTDIGAISDVILIKNAHAAKNTEITSTNGSKIVANNSITINSDVTLKDEIILVIGLPDNNPAAPSSNPVNQSLYSTTDDSPQSPKPEQESVSEQKVNARANSEELKEKELETTAYPNPTSGKVTFRYSILQPSQTQLTLHDTNGKLIDKVVSDYQQAGIHEISYNLYTLPNGIYVYTLETSEGKETKRIVVIR